MPCVPLESTRSGCRSTWPSSWMATADGPSAGVKNACLVMSMVSSRFGPLWRPRWRVARYLTLYAFSTENWNRPKEEVDALMDLLVKTLVQEAMELGSKGVRLWAIGDVSSLPQACQAELDRVKDGSEGEVHLDLVLALSYSAKWEMVEAIRTMMKEGLAPEEVLPSTIDKYLQTADLPDPEPDPHLWGTSHQQLHVVAIGVRRIPLHLSALARFQKNAFFRCHPRFSTPGTPIWCAPTNPAELIRGMRTVALLCCMLLGWLERPMPRGSRP